MAHPIPDAELDSFSYRLRNAVVIVTGGANGIGRATALRCATFGAKIVIGDLDILGAETTRQLIKENGGECLAVRCDVTSWEDQVKLFLSALNEFGPISVVVANAGVPEMPETGKLVFDTEGRPLPPNMLTTQVNLLGTIYTTHLATHYLHQNAMDGSLKTLILVASMAGLVTLRGAPQYTASKHAVLGFMRAIASPHAKLGVKIAAVAPWFVDTGLLPDDIKMLLSGLKYVPIDRAVQSIIYAATEPDANSTGGCIYAIPDGTSSVMRFPSDVHVEGVFSELNARLELVFGLAAVMQWAPRLAKRISAATLLGVSAWFLWRRI